MLSNHGIFFPENRLAPAAFGLASIWLPDLNLGLGLWQGEFDGVWGHWLRWRNADGQWLLTDTEQERLAKEQAQHRAEQLAQQLRELGMNPDQV